MSLYSLDTIIESGNKSLFAPVEIHSEESSLFVQTLHDILENNKFVSTGIDSINESVGESISDFIKKQTKNSLKKLISGIFKMFRMILEKLWNQFKALMVQLQDQKFALNKYKNVLLNYTDSISYNGRNYIFTNLGADYALVAYKIQLENIYKELTEDLNSLSNINNTESLYTTIKDIREKRENTDTLSEVRARSVGSYETFSVDEYGNKLFGYFRNGGSEYNTGVISSSDVIKIAERYFSKDVLTSNAEKEKNELRKISVQMEKRLQEVKINSFVQIEVNNDIISETDNIIKKSCNVVNGICNIYLQFFSAKIDAIKDYRKQDMDILIYAVREYVAKGGKR